MQGQQVQRGTLEPPGPLGPRVKLALQAQPAKLDLLEPLAKLEL